jgi:hypothetical protein
LLKNGTKLDFLRFTNVDPNSPARLHLIHVAVNLEQNAMHRFKRLMMTDQRRGDDNIFAMMGWIKLSFGSKFTNFGVLDN